MKKRLENLADRLLEPINPSAIVILAVYTILWGLWLVSPLWTVFDTATIFTVMGSVMPEIAWGAIALISGVLILYGVLKPSYPNLTRGALVGFLLWGVIGMFYLFADWHSTGGITALTFAVYSAYIYVNIRVNRVIPNKKKRSGSHGDNTR